VREDGERGGGIRSRARGIPFQTSRWTRGAIATIHLVEWTFKQADSGALLLVSSR
jgi:hypothetical protein